MNTLADIADKEVGIKEVGGNNRGERIEDYQRATWLAPGPWPWCAAFVCWVILQWLGDKANVRWLNLQTVTTDAWRPKTAGAWDFLNWAKARPKTVEILPETAHAQAGDIVVFDFSHIGIVAEERNGLLFTIEGNTNAQGTRDSTSGDGVFRKVRHKSLARAFLRIRPSA